MKKFFVLLLLPLQLFAGTYTPTATAVSDAVVNSSEKAQYFSVDEIVHVSGAVTVSAHDGEAPLEVRISLPVASDLESSLDCHGVVGEIENWNVGAVVADAANDSVIISTMPSASCSTYCIPLHLFYSFDCEIK